MARPFRHEPPVPPAAMLPRRRLVDRLDERWSRRLVTVVAGPGFGKTSLLAAAVRAEAEAGHRDVWMTCEPADASAVHLVSGLAAAVGLDASSDLDRLLDWVWAQAPTEICLVLDDVHEVIRGSEGASVLAHLLDDLPANGHLVLASRQRPPIPTARWTASRAVVHLGEAALLLDDAELREFAALRGVDEDVVVSSAGWPALAELAATAGTGVLAEYLWEEVLTALGPERAKLLTRLSLVGGGDDDVASAFAGREVRVADVVDGVPLVERRGDGWVRLHPLWAAQLDRLIAPKEATDALLTAAAVHQGAGRLELAAGLLVRAHNWDRLLDLLRDAVVENVGTDLIIGWYNALPVSHHDAPAALHGRALEVRRRDLAASPAAFAEAAAAFREAGDIQGETASILAESNARWWVGDVAGFPPLFERIAELAATGYKRAAALEAIMQAAVAHSAGDAQRVLDLLEGVRGDVPPGWPVDLWFVNAAHRRLGHLDAAHDALVRYARETRKPDEQMIAAQLRIDWLRGRVDDVVRALPELVELYAPVERYLHAEVAFELAVRAAWLGDTDRAREALSTVREDEASDAYTRVLRLMALATIAVSDGDEAAATELLSAKEARPGRFTSWYWFDRGVLALPYLLRPDARDAWRAEPTGPAHAAGWTLVEALRSAREGRGSGVRDFVWPEVGLVRAHLPRRWAIHLAVAATAAGNPPPTALLEAIGPAARDDLRELADARTGAALTRAAKQLISRVPPPTTRHVRVAVLGQLELRANDIVVAHHHLRRQRVRELLCLLVARRRVRREEAADALWPDLTDPGRNLRTTLNYLQQVLQPDRPEGEAPYFVRADGPWLSLLDGAGLYVDAWDLEAHLATAERAEAAGAMSDALDAYRRVLPLWRGEPFADAGGQWAHGERSRLRSRYVVAAVRAGDLLVARGDLTAAHLAAESAVAADPAHEAAYRLLERVHRQAGDPTGARDAAARYEHALADLGVSATGSRLPSRP